MIIDRPDISHARGNVRTGGWINSETSVCTRSTLQAARAKVLYAKIPTIQRKGWSPHESESLREKRMHTVVRKGSARGETHL